jgi:rhodanese-related sulfurtransferase
MMNDPRVPTITVQELHELRQREPVEIIDVRTPEEFQAVRATDVRLMPLDALDPQALVESRTLAADAPLYFICHSGGRSEWACMAMLAAGYSNVANVVGGTLAWEMAGLPVERG